MDWVGTLEVRFRLLELLFRLLELSGEFWNTNHGIVVDKSGVGE